MIGMTSPAQIPFDAVRTALRIFDMEFSLIILLIIGLLFIFVGRRLVKILTFIVGGFLGAALAYGYGLTSFGLPTAYAIAALGFIVGGLIAYVLLYVIAGALAGLMVYQATRPLFPDFTIPLILAIIAFFIIIVLFNQLLSIGTAFLGALMVSASLGRLIPVSPLLMMILIIVLAVAGAYIQFKQS